MLRIDKFPPYPIATRSLFVRPFQAFDFDAYAELTGDADTKRAQRTYALNREAAREPFEGKMRERTGYPGTSRLPLVVAEQATDRFIGEVSLIRHGIDQAELGYAIIPAYRGRGFAAEASNVLLKLAFDHMGMRRVTARCDERNVASYRVMERLGMRREGLFIEDVVMGEERCNTLSYAILEDEWRARLGWL